MPSDTAEAKWWLLLDITSTCCHEGTGVILHVFVELRFEVLCSFLSCAAATVPLPICPLWKGAVGAGMAAPALSSL